MLCTITCEQAWCCHGQNEYSCRKNFHLNTLVYTKTLLSMLGIDCLKYHCSNCGEMTRPERKVHILLAWLIQISNFEKSFVAINVDFCDCQNIVVCGEKQTVYCIVICWNSCIFFNKRTKLLKNEIEHFVKQSPDN